MDNQNKPNAGQLARHESRLKTGQFVPKIWGGEKILKVVEVEGRPEQTRMVKELLMSAGKMCSVQYHEIKREKVFGKQGKLEVVFLKPEFKNSSLAIPQNLDNAAELEQWVQRRVFLESSSDTVEVQPGQIHFMRAANEDAVYLEESVGPNETIRVWDPYKDLRTEEDKAK